MAEMIKKSLDEILIERGLVSKEKYQEATKKAKSTGKSIKETLVELKLIDEDQLINTLGEALNLSVIANLSDVIDTDSVKLLKEEKAREFNAIPLFKAGDLMMVAMVDPLNVFALDEIEQAVGCKVEPVLSRIKEILRAIDKFYGKEDQISGIVEEAKSEEAVMELAGGEDIVETETKKEIDAPIVKLVNVMMNQAVKEGASDVHVEPEEDRLRVRLRIDGVLNETMFPPRQLQPSIISRIKIMSGMDIAEKRLPQDGRFKIHSGEKHFDVRVSSVPTIYGEKIVMRLLDQTSIHLKVEQLGFEPATLRTFNAVINQPNGILLVTGPTGSGKTTTLYTALEAINSSDKNIMTIEDPVEYRLKGINQVPVRSKIGVTFAGVLRTALRQDPDIIMIGEMRDLETAETAIRAALTGHFVFSTLHTNDAPGAVTRLVDMGVAPYLVASSVTAILAQRLVRGICPKCKEKFSPSADLLKDLGLDPKKKVSFYRGKGCDECNGTGYKGRMGVYEFFLMNDEIRRLTIDHAAADVIRDAARKFGMKTLMEDGLEKAARGLTTLEEVQRVLLIAGEE